MSSSAPAAPDYTGAAEATAASSKDVTEQQTFANRPNVNTPWSSQTWANTPTWDPTTGQYLNQWTQNTELTPDAQTALNNQLDVTKNLSGTADQLLTQNNSAITAPLDWSNFEQLGAVPQAQNYQAPTLNNNIDTSNLPAVGGADSYATKAGDAAFQQYTARNQPIQDRQTQQMQTQLANQGLAPGDEAYDTAMKTLSQQQSDANTNASLAATQTGIQGGATEQGEDLAANANQYSQNSNNATFANSAANQAFANSLTGGAQTYGEQNTSATLADTTRQQQISEDLQQRGYSLNEITALLNGQQVSTGPQANFNAAGASTGANYANAAAQNYAAATNATNVDNANTGTAVGAGVGIAGVAAIAI